MSHPEKLFLNADLSLSPAWTQVTFLYDEYFYAPYWERADKPSDLNTYGFGLFYKQYFGKTFAPMGAM